MCVTETQGCIKLHSAVFVAALNELKSRFLNYIFTNIFMTCVKANK